MLETQSQPTNELFDSRKVPRSKGIGYPSCCTDIALPPLNTRDPHGYYRDIGVDPWATHDQIKSRVRELFRQHHPDTGDGDTERFNRVRLISEVLLDPIARDKYNRTPPGMRLMDAVYEAELSKIDAFQTLDEEQLREALQPRNANPYSDRLSARYDYFARDHLSDPWRADGMKAQLWYHFLIEAAPMVGYKRVIKVMMVAGEPAWHHDVGIIEIPRSWEPSSALALSLWTVVAGFRPGHNDPQTRLSTSRPHLSE